MRSVAIGLRAVTREKRVKGQILFAALAAVCCCLLLFAEYSRLLRTRMNTTLARKGERE